MTDSDLGGDHKELYHDNIFNNKMYERLMEKQSDPGYQKMLTFRKKLPSYGMKEVRLDGSSFQEKNRQVEEWG